MAESEAEQNGPGLLPEPVRLRALSLAADAVGQIQADQLPPSLRRVASFAPAQRARRAGTQIAAALEGDEAFRERVATQVRAAVPALATALDERTPPPAASPVEVAAVAYLLRTQGWDDLVAAAREVRRDTAGDADQSGAVERLQRQLQDARDDVRAAQGKAKEQVGQIKTENADLRRKLADSRRRVAEAEATAREAATAQEAALQDTAALEAENRRLRARISELEAGAAAARRSARDDRDAASRRARLLLDTLLDAGQGLRRELALPPASGSPADDVEATVTALAGEPSTASAAGMALSTDDPALLEELFSLPGVHVIVDGYNVTKTAWPSAPLESQRSRLLNGLAPLVARNRAEMTVVFDGADLRDRPPVGGPRGVRVVFSPPGVIADDVIHDFVSAEPAGRPLVVVSSDREVALAAYRAGARAVEAAALARLLARA